MYTITVLRQILKIVLLAPWLLLWGCTGIDIERPVPGPVKVALAVGQGVATKTEYNEAAKRFVWRPGDKTAVWAESQTGDFRIGRPRIPPDGVRPGPGRVLRLLHKHFSVSDG